MLKITKHLARKLRSALPRSRTPSPRSPSGMCAVEGRCMSAAGITDTGLVRPSNEDALFINEGAGIFIVADGMGGHSAGEVASRMAVEHVSRALMHIRPSHHTTPPEETLSAVFTETNAAVHQAGIDNSAYRQMGCTLIVAWKIRDACFIAHVGDVRGYLLRDSRLQQLTADHTRVAAMVERGEISPQEARHHPLRNRILRAVGPQPTLTCDVARLALQPDDRLLLCSDGLWDMVEDEHIAATLARGEDCLAACRSLVEQALAAGGKDNITVLIMDVR